MTKSNITAVMAEFESKFCNNHQKPTRFLRGVFYDEQDGAEQIGQFIFEALTRIEKEAREQSELRGIGKILDILWDNSINTMGEKGSDRIKEEMIYYFGENWTTDMYCFIAEKKNPVTHFDAPKTLKDLTKERKDIK